MSQSSAFDMKQPILRVRVSDPRKPRLYRKNSLQSLHSVYSVTPTKVADSSAKGLACRIPDLKSH